MLFPRFNGILLALLLAAFSACAQNERFVPANPPAMLPLHNAQSPAHQAAAHFLRGVNLGNYLEVPVGQKWGVHITAADFDHIRDQGFDHIRVPVAWQFYAGPAPGFKLDETIFARVDFVLTNALARHLAVIINLHGFDDFTSDPTNQTAKLIALWDQIAAHYAAAPDTIAFELLNEPHGVTTTAVMNPIYPQVIAAIRRTNPHRALLIGPGEWDNIRELKNLILPADDDNLIVTVHCYEPFHFTHQGANWVGADEQIGPIQFPGPPATPLEPPASLKVNAATRDWIRRYNTEPAEKNPSSAFAFVGRLQLVRAWSDYYGRPVYLGEFGAFTTADQASRARFYGEFRQALAAQKIGWAIWDWSAGFRYWNSRRQEPLPGMKNALFGTP